MAASNKTTINRVTDDHFDKDKALEAALQQIQKQYGKGAIMKLGESGGLNIETISTGSVSLDIATGVSGIPRGRITEIYGPESSGKTTLACPPVGCSAGQSWPPPPSPCRTKEAVRGHARQTGRRSRETSSPSTPAPPES